MLSFDLTETDDQRGLAAPKHFDLSGLSEQKGIAGYDPSQPRDDAGRWTGGGSSLAPDSGDGGGAQGSSPSESPTESNTANFPTGKIGPPAKALGPVKIRPKDSAAEEAERFAERYAEHGKEPGNFSDHGVQETFSAIASEGADRVILRDFSADGYPVAGAISYYIDDGELTIAHLGSTGDVKGTGTELVRYAVDRARKAGVGIKFESTPNAEGFYEHVGFARIDGKVFGASGDRLHAISKRIGRPGRAHKEPPAKEFLPLTKGIQGKIARTLVKAAHQRQAERVQRQAARKLAKYFQASVNHITTRLFAESWSPNPENAKAQAARLIRAAFDKDAQGDLLIDSASQPVADAFVEGAAAEMRLTAAARRRKAYDPSQPRDDHGRWSEGGGGGGSSSRIFTSREDAETWIKDSGYADSADLAGATPEEASAIASALEKSLVVGDRTLKLRSIAINGEGGPEGSNYGAAYSNGHVFIDPGHLEMLRSHDRESRLSQYQGDDAGQRSFAWEEGRDPSEALAITVAHEAGHHAETALLLDIGKGVRNSGHEFTTDDVSREVSGYASTHPVENFAEMHAFVSTGNSDKLSPRMLEVYNAVLATADADGIPSFIAKSVKVTTASEAAERAEEDIDFPTEAPDWLVEAAQDFILEVFQEDYWLRIPEHTRDDIELTLYNAIADGRSIRDIASEIQDRHGAQYTRARATMVARTEMTGAMNAGHTEAIREAYGGIPDIQPAKEWLSVHSLTTREEHSEADGQIVPLDDDFEVGGERCAFPGDARLSAAMRINCMCVPAGSHIAATGGQVVAATNMLYSGPLVEIETRSGRIGKATPNHPVLTTKGWVRYGDLQRGDYVIACEVRDESRLGAVENKQQKPLLVEDVFETLKAAAKDVKVAARLPFQSHGDAQNGQGKVHVVVADWMLPLPSGDDACKHRKEFSLAGAARKVGSSHRGVHVPAGPSETLSVRVGAKHAMPLEATLDHRPGHTKAIRQFNLPHAAEVEAADLLLVEWDSLRAGPAREIEGKWTNRSDAAGAQTSLDGAAGHSVLPGDSDDTGPVVIFADEVIDRRERVLQGHRHVYDLQCQRGWYASDGIIVHNCTIVSAFVGEGLEDDEEKGWQDQPRVPAGSPEGGQFGSGGSGDSAPADEPSSQAMSGLAVEHVSKAKEVVSKHADAIKSGDESAVQRARQEYYAALGMGKKDIIEVNKRLDEWADSAYSSGAQDLRKVAAKAYGRDFKTDEFHDGSTVKGGHPPEHVETAILADRAFTVEALRAVHGDELTVYRGVASTYGNQLADAIKSEGSIELGQNAITSWTTDKNMAIQFAVNGPGNVRGAQSNLGRGVVIAQKVKVEDVWLSDLTSKKVGEWEIGLGTKSSRTSFSKSQVTIYKKKETKEADNDEPVKAESFAAIDDDPGHANWMNASRPAGDVSDAEVVIADEGDADAKGYDPSQPREEADESQ